MRRFWAKPCAAAIAALVSLTVVATAGAAVVGGTPVTSYQANGNVRTVIVVGNTAYIGGQFTAMLPSGSTGAGAVTRNGAAAVNLTTGALLPWNPNVTGGAVYALKAVGSNIYLGGAFTNVGGTGRRDIAKVNNSNGALVTQFHAPNPNHAVRAIEISGNTLYVGGAFLQIGATVRNYVAQLDATTGALNPNWQPVVNGEVHAIALNPAGNRVILGGFFNRINSGAPGDPNTTNLGVGAVDTVTGASLPWAWHTTDLQTFRPFQLLQFAQDGSTLYGAGTGNGGAAMSWDIETGQLNYIEGFNGNVTGVGINNGYLYIGGHFSDYCGPIPGSNFVCAGIPGSAARAKLTAVDQTTGALQSWAPSVNTALGVFTLAAGNGYVVIGGEFTRVAGVSQQRFAVFREPGAQVVITDPAVTDNSATQPATGPVTVTASGSASSAGGAVSYRHQSSTDGGSTWSGSVTGTSVTITAAGTTLVRFQAFDAGGHTSNWVTDAVTIQSGGGGGGSATVTLHNSATGVAGSGGNATVKGTYTCDGAGPVTISGTITQASTGASGNFSVTVPCPDNSTATKWQTLAHANSTPFANGSASLHSNWAANDLSNNQPISGSVTTTVTLT